MSYNRTVTEFSGRRKIVYGDKVEEKPLQQQTSSLNAASLSFDPSLSTHKTYFGKDSTTNSEAYFIEFNIGNFKFDEITIKTEGRRLIVQGKSNLGEKTNELSREFNREFRLPDEVDPYSIQAQLDEKTRMLSLICQLNEIRQTDKQSEVSSTLSSSANFGFNSSASSLASASTLNTAILAQSSNKIGQVKENKTPTTVDYEIYLGNELKDGQINFEIANYNTLIVKITKSDWDKSGDLNLELKRQIKLPPNANAQHIEQGIDNRTGTLVIKVPLK